MQLQTIVSRISECIDDLGLLLDRIYKFPQKQRQLYFDKIQSMKNKLLTLKVNVRQTNANASQKQYKQIYLAINSLKAEITQQTNLMSVLKESKQMNRPKDKQVKRNHNEAMKLIVQKQLQINQLQKLVVQKQDLIKNNQGEMKKVKLERDSLAEENRQLLQSYESLNIQFKNQQQELIGLQKSFKDSEQSLAQKEQALTDAFEQIRKIKNDLTAANGRINHFQQLAQISMNKTRLVEQNMRRIQENAQDLNDSFKIKEKDILSKVRQTGELQYGLACSTDKIKELELQSKMLLQDLQVLQNQSTKLQAKEQQTQITNQLLQDRVRKLQQNNQRLELQLQISLQQKQSNYKQHQDLLFVNRSLEMQILKLNQKYTTKENEYIKIYQKLQIIHKKVKQYERILAIRETALQRVQKQLVQAKTRELQLSQKYDSRDREIQLLKVRLLKAKIQTLYQIRQII